MMIVMETSMRLRGICLWTRGLYEPILHQWQIFPCFVAISAGPDDDCNGLDDDCDGRVDESFSGASCGTGVCTGRERCANRVNAM